MKLLLIATTALVCITSLATAGTLPERQPGPARGLDTNGEFLCNHGFTIHTFVSFNSGYYYTKWERAATPIIGKGEFVGALTVEDGPTYSGFQVAIYSSFNGRPYKQLAEGDQQSQAGCSRVTVRITPTVKLQTGKKYWVVETAVYSSSDGSNSVVWLFDPKRSHGALKQSGYQCNWSGCSGQPSITHLGQWKPIRRGVPYVRVGTNADTPAPIRPVPSAGDGSASATIVPISHGAQIGHVPRYPP